MPPRPPKGVRWGGRAKGTPNKVNGAFKLALLEAFHQIGGAEALAVWAVEEKNRGTFYQICGRLIPTEVVGSSDPSAEPVRYVVEHVYQPKP